jgi:hypothetical protein
VVTGTVWAYREWMRRFAGMRNLAVWYAQADADQISAEFADQLGAAGRRRVSRALAKARTRDSLQAFEKLTVLVDGERRIAADPPLVMSIEDLLPDVRRAELEQQLHGLIHQYRDSLESHHRTLLEQFRPVHMARKVVGVGSVGTRCWIILLLGRDDQDPLLLQAKEAQASVLAEHAGPSEYANQGQRVVAGQRLMQAASDIFLGWQHVAGIDGRPRDFYVRQLYDWKGIAQVENMAPKGMRWFGRLCGATLARAHARSGDRIAIASYLGRNDAFDQALGRFAEAYADQNERDHQALVEAELSASACNAGRCAELRSRAVDQVSSSSSSSSSPSTSTSNSARTLSGTCRLTVAPPRSISTSPPSARARASADNRCAACCRDSVSLCSSFMSAMAASGRRRTIVRRGNGPSSAACAPAALCADRLQLGV